MKPQLSPVTAVRFGFKGRQQLALFMVWREYFDRNGDVEFASVIFTSRDWIGF
jgi:hypothetical protein